MAGDVEKAALAAGGLDLPGHTGPHRSRRATGQWAYIDDRQHGRATRTCHAPILPDTRTTDRNEAADTSCRPTEWSSRGSGRAGWTAALCGAGRFRSASASFQPGMRCFPQQPMVRSCEALSPDLVGELKCFAFTPEHC